MYLTCGRRKNRPQRHHDVCLGLRCQSLRVVRTAIEGTGKSVEAYFCGYRSLEDRNVQRLRARRAMKK